MLQLNYSFKSNLVCNLAASHTLLNCLVKEFALPMGLCSYEWPSDISGIPIGVFFNGKLIEGIPLHIHMPNEQEFFILVDRKDCLGAQYYLSDIYTRKLEDKWQYLDFEEFVNLLLESCSAITGYHNKELIEQIYASRILKKQIHHFAQQQDQNPLETYARSEQALWFGHPTHPAPKARLWSTQQQNNFSPEFAIPNALYKFEVPKNGLLLRVNGQLTDTEILQEIADQPENPDKVIICLHPVQAQLFLQDERVQSYIKKGIITDLGCVGEKFVPTASIRTWFSSKHNFFIKGSLHVRITNCVRKNAWYELESTLLIDKIFKKLLSSQAETFTSFQPVAEPAVLSWAPIDVSPEDQLWFQEQTGTIFRENFCKTEGDNNCLLAGTVFGRSHDLIPNIIDFLRTHLNRDLQDQDLLNWFKQYQSLLLNPVLSLFYQYGIVMEPHLQNSVLVHQNSIPMKVLLRDFEGVKLTSDVGILLIQEEEIHPRVKQSVEYSREKGWKRISYCLFVNHLSEAILALTWQRPALAVQMWQFVYDELEKFRNSISVPTPEIDALLAGAPIHCKTNFKVRLAGNADRDAGYVQLASPWSSANV